MQGDISFHFFVNSVAFRTPITVCVAGNMCMYIYKKSSYHRGCLEWCVPICMNKKKLGGRSRNIHLHQLPFQNSTTYHMDVFER